MLFEQLINDMQVVMRGGMHLIILVVEVVEHEV